MRNCLAWCLLILATGTSSSCVSRDILNDPGLGPREEKILMLPITQARRTKAPTDAELHALFRKPGSAGLDGEAALNRTEDLYLALFQTGDVRFAEALSQEEAPVRQAVTSRLKVRWKTLVASGVSSPRVEALLTEN